MTQEQYRHEMIQKAFLDCGRTDDHAERLRICGEIASMLNDFWTVERTLDYINYITAPEGAVCPELGPGGKFYGRAKG